MTNASSIAIHRVPVMSLSMVNAFVITSEQGCILVDAGLPDSAPKFAKVLGRLGLTPSDVRLIVVTHAHIDHAGAAAELRELTGAPILAHPGERRFLTGEAQMSFCPTGWFGRLFYKTGAIQAPFQHFEPDLLTEGDFDLTPFGVDGKVVHSAGHTEGGCLSVQLAGGQALTGDLVASGILLGGIVAKGRPKRPPFEAAPAQVADSLEQLLASGSQSFHLGHGGPLHAPQVRRHIVHLRRVAEVAKGAI